MKKIRVVIQALFYTAVFFWVLCQSYAIGLLGGGAGLALVLACWSALKPLPLFVAENLWLLYLLSGIPLGIYSAFFVFRNLIRSRRLKQDNTQGNGNQ